MAHNVARFQCPRCHEDFMVSADKVPVCPVCGYSTEVAVINLLAPSAEAVVLDNVGIEYLGDGVYAVLDQHQGIWLHANHHKTPTDRVYLEPSVLKALVRFAQGRGVLDKEGK